MADAVLENVTKSFGEAIAVENLGLTVSHGEFLVLLGQPGRERPLRSDCWPGWNCPIPARFI